MGQGRVCGRPNDTVTLARERRAVRKRARGREEIGAPSRVCSGKAAPPGCSAVSLQSCRAAWRTLWSFSTPAVLRFCVPKAGTVTVPRRGPSPCAASLRLHGADTGLPAGAPHGAALLEHVEPHRAAGGIPALGGSTAGSIAAAAVAQLPRVRLSSHPCSHCSAPLLSVPRQNRSSGAMVTGGGGVGGPSSLLAAFPRGVVLFRFGVSLDAWALRPTQVGKCALFVWEWQTCLTARSSETAPSAAPRRAHSGRLSASVPTAQRSALPSAHSPHCEPLQPSSPPPPPPAAPGLP